jgi:beta-glucosidase
MPVSIARAEADYCGYDLQPDCDGRLAYTEATRFGYRGLIAGERPARHAFGSGMGYACFEWRDAAQDGDGVVITVCNISDRAGSDVVQLYRDAPECALLGFAKVHLQPGEKRQVTIVPEQRMLRTWRDAAWQEMRGKITVRLARSAEDPGLPLDLYR